MASDDALEVGQARARHLLDQRTISEVRSTRLSAGGSVRITTMVPSGLISTAVALACFAARIARATSA
jgi:hypothetical protein